MSVRFEIREGGALITIDNPPVNVVSQAVRAGLVEALDKAEAAGVSRIVITGAGRTFIAGADAKEFDAAPVPPHMPDIVSRIEASPVPVVAAINGAALGGGLELALACRARVAAPTATLGLPEVTLGVVPGAGGTQRLPRLIGLSNALSLIAEGRVITALEAEKLGLVDTLSHDPLEKAFSMALPQRPVTGEMPAPQADDATIEAARTQAKRRTPGQIAPQKAIELVAATSRLSLAEGLAEERRVFLDLKTSDQAAALRHIFFAERTALGRGRSGGEEITRAVVVGGGTMGASIAYALAGTGIQVALVEVDVRAVERARANVDALYAEAVKRGKMTAETASGERAARFTFHVGYGTLPPAEIAIEAAFEDMEVKQAIFARLDEALPDSTILATNTSYLDVNRIAGSVRNPSRVLGLHFFSPAHLMKLLEVVRARETSDATMATALRLAARLKKISVLAGVCDGFIGNRILTRYRQTTDLLLMAGAMPWQVDTAMRRFGMAMGPYEVQDLSGLDIAYANRKRLNWKARTDIRYVPIADRIVEETGRLGRKTGAGWYDYADGKATPSPLIERIVMEASDRAGIVRRTFSDDDIVEHAVTAMIEEGLHILEEGIAETPADIDLVLVHGYAFPRWRGGPMQTAERHGLSAVLERIERFSTQDPVSWRVPPLLRRAVSEGKSLLELSGRA
ncbi:MAG: enoyl-CoA hydratase/isomerase family protein [Proteobacteria bacterium]|nr:enoyl-CoA hydratase/isomerase family protein [Pseudomonadota bacterium]